MLARIPVDTDTESGAPANAETKAEAKVVGGLTGVKKVVQVIEPLEKEIPRAFEKNTSTPTSSQESSYGLQEIRLLDPEMSVALHADMTSQDIEHSKIFAEEFKLFKLFCVLFNASAVVTCFTLGIYAWPQTQSPPARARAISEHLHTTVRPVLVLPILYMARPTPISRPIPACDVHECVRTLLLNCVLCDPLRTGGSCPGMLRLRSRVQAG